MYGLIIFLLLSTVTAIPSTNNNCGRPTQKRVTRAYSKTNDAENVPSYAQQQYMCQIESNTTIFTFNTEDVVDTSGKWIIYFGVSSDLTVKIDNTLWLEFTQSDKFYFAQVDHYPKQISFARKKASSEPFFIISPSLFKYHPKIVNSSTTTIIVSLVITSCFVVLCGWTYFWLL